MWGSHKTDRRGTIITDLIDEHSLTILNEKLPTHIADSNGRFTAIDLTLCTQNLINFTEWIVLDDLHGSDHFPIVISFPFTQHQKSQRQVYNIKKADWIEFQRNINIDDINTTDINSMAEDFTQRIIHAAHKSISQTKTFSGKRKLPYWNDEIKNKIVERKKSIKLYRNTLNPDIRTKIGALTTEIKELIQKSRTESWRNYTNSINHKAITKEI
jgi:hypothetical protein